MEKLRVKAGANGPVRLPAPIQGAWWIGDQPVELESTRFLRRRLEVGDLVEVKEPAAVARREKDRE